MALPEQPSSKEEVVYDEEMSPLQKDDPREKFLPPCQDSFEEEVAVSFHSVVQWFNRSLGVPHGQHVSGCVWMRCVGSREAKEAAIYVHVHIL